MISGSFYTLKGGFGLIATGPNSNFLDLQIRAPYIGYVLGRVDPSSEFLKDGEVQPRPQMGLSQTSDGLTVRVENIPTGTELRYPGGVATIDDGFFEWSTVEGGEYEFSLTNFPYKDEVIKCLL